jgi:hypothetical protein
VTEPLAGRQHPRESISLPNFGDSCRLGRAGGEGRLPEAPLRTNRKGPGTGALILLVRKGGFQRASTTGYQRVPARLESPVNR